MKKQTRLLALILCIVLTVSLLAGCGSTAQNASTPTPAVGTPAPDASVPAPAEPGEAAEPVEDQTLVISGTQPISVSLDRYNTTGTEGPKLECTWGDPLVWDNGEGFIPWLAESYEYSDDNLSCTFKLREGVLFHNGKEMTSEDVKATWDRVMTDTSLKTNSSVMKGVESVTCEDDYTVVFKFKNLYPGFLADCSGTQIVDGEALQADPANFFLNPIATGPYKVASYNPVDSILVLERFDEWWGWNVDGREMSNVKEITFVHTSDISTRVAGLRAGDFDVVETVSADYIETLEAEGFVCDPVVFLQTVFLLFNCEDGSVFSNKELREAVSACIDRQAIVDNIMSGGMASVAAMPAGVNGSDNLSVKYSYDTEKAKALVEKSGYGGEEVSLLCSGSIYRETELVQALQAMLGSIGIKVSINSCDNAVYQTDMADGNYDICLNSFTWAGADPYKNMADRVYNGGNVGTGYVNDELNALIEAASSQFGDERAATIGQIYDIVSGECAPFISLFELQNVMASKAGVSGISLNPRNKGWLIKYPMVEIG